MLVSWNIVAAPRSTSDLAPPLPVRKNRRNNPTAPTDRKEFTTAMNAALRIGFLSLCLAVHWSASSSATPEDPPVATPHASVPRPGEWWQGDSVPATGSGHQRSRGSKPPRIEVFEKSWKRGHRVRLEGPVADVTELGHPVGSLIVKAGSWQLCSRPDFQGECRVVDGRSEKVADGMVVASLRPVPY